MKTIIFEIPVFLVHPVLTVFRHLFSIAFNQVHESPIRGVCGCEFFANVRCDL